MCGRPVGDVVLGGGARRPVRVAAASAVVFLHGAFFLIIVWAIIMTRVFCSQGSDRATVAGLGSVRLAVSVNGRDDARLPTAHTCFNHLMLPRYSCREVLRERLTTAIDNAVGFGLQ